VVKSLSEGGQAHTFLVLESGDEDRKLFVLKRLRNPNRVDRFKQEIRAYNELSHQNLLKIVDCDLEASKPYLVSEYCSGGTLADADLAKYSLQDRLSMFVEICRGVAAAHAHDPAIVHRDLKPANVFLREDNTPVIGDFGICHYKDGERLTVVDEVVGPLWYVAPELAHGLADDDDVTPAADVYSLGKLLYWMLKGRIFDREVYRTPRFDLTKDQTRPDYFFIYDLFDKTIVEDWSKRLGDADQVADATESIIRGIKMDAHYLDLSVPQACTYCGVGNYQLVLDASRETQGVNLTSSVQNFGFYGGINDPIWLVLACDHCGNIQAFRPDLATDRDIWKRKSDATR